MSDSKGSASTVDEKNPVKVSTKPAPQSSPKPQNKPQPKQKKKGKHDNARKYAVIAVSTIFCGIMGFLISSAHYDKKEREEREQREAALLRAVKQHQCAHCSHHDHGHTHAPPRNTQAPVDVAYVPSPPPPAFDAPLATPEKAPLEPVVQQTTEQIQTIETVEVVEKAPRD